MWFNLEPADLPFVANSPWRFDVAEIVAAPPMRVFEAFAQPEKMAHWIIGFRRCEWKSEPGGSGAVRELELTGIAFREHFLAWEPGRRACFAIDAMTVPLMQKMVEDVQIDPIGPDRSRLVWTVHYQPTLLLHLGHPLARWALERGYRASAERLARFVLAN